VLLAGYRRNLRSRRQSAIRPVAKTAHGTITRTLVPVTVAASPKHPSGHAVAVPAWCRGCDGEMETAIRHRVRLRGAGLVIASA